MPLFFGHNPGLRDYKDASKIKTLEVHPVLPWVLTADEDGIVTIWDYQSECIVLSFAADSIKDGQRSAVAAIDAQAAFAAAHDVAVPDIAGPGLGAGPVVEPGATAGSGTETFISAVVGGVSKRRTATSGLGEDARRGRTGAVRSVKFADEHVLSWYCGQGAGDFENTDVHGNVGHAAKGSIPPMCSSMDGVAGLGSYSSVSIGGAGSSMQSGAGGTGGPSGMHRRRSISTAKGMSASAPASAVQNWVLILCEHRVLVLDYSTRSVIDIAHASLLVETTGPANLQRTTTKGKPGVHSAALIGPGVIAFGCEDGVLRIWACDADAVIQSVRSGQAGSGKPLGSLHVANTCPYAVPGTSQALSPVSPLAAVHREARTLLIAGASDGVVSVYEIIGGRMVLDSSSMGGGPSGSGAQSSNAAAQATAALAAAGGSQRLKLPGELSDLTVGTITMHAVALGSDRSVTVWDCASRPSQPGSAPRVAQSRIGTSSSAAEGGVGSRLMAAVTMGSHPALPPSTLLVAGKGPHLELAIAGSAEKGPGAESGIIFYDLRTARPGLPSKLKIYALSRHPFRPEIVAAGTNIGVFVLSVAPHYTMGAACATHPAWRIPPAVTDELSPEGQRVAEGQVVLHVNVQGMLVASEVRVTTPASEEDEEAGMCGACPLPRGPGGLLPRLTGKAASSAPMGLDVSGADHVLLPVLSPAMPPPTTMVRASKEVPSPAHNAVAQLMAVIKGSPMSGTKGVRLRVSGSGRYIAAVWPEHKYYAVYKVNIPVGVKPSPASAAAGAGAGSGGPEQMGKGESRAGEDEDAASEGEGPANSSVDADWSCEYVDGGAGVDVAWAGPTVGSYDDHHANSKLLGGDKAQPGAPMINRWDRYVVLEPGQVLTGRGPMGGGMAIGSSAPQAGKGSKEKDKDEGAGARAGKEPKVAVTPATLSLRQLPVLDDPSIDPGKVVVVASDLAFPQGMEPTAISANGPLLAVALAPEIGYLTYNPQQPLNQSSLTFHMWTCMDPDPAAVAEEEKKGAESRYSGAQKSKVARHRLVQAGGGSSIPCPSLQALAAGQGVIWNVEATRVAVLTPFYVHILAHYSPRRLAASTHSSGPGMGMGMGTQVKPPHGVLVELCRVPLQALSATWMGAALIVSTGDARLVAICPPVIDPHVVAQVSLGGNSASGSSLGLTGTVGSLLVVNGARIQPLVVDLQSLTPGSALASILGSSALPTPRRGLAHVSACAPLFCARGFVVTAHWTGSRGNANLAYGPPTAAGAGNGGVHITAVSCGHPGLRAAMAVSWAGSSDFRSGTGSYIQSSTWAASWGARLPASTHTQLARHLADLGSLSAALLLPGLCASAGIALALSKRLDVYVRAHGRGGGKGWTAIDLRVSVAYLLHLLATVDDSELLMLAGPSALCGPDAHDVYGAATLESDVNVVGVWVQTAAFLSMVAASLDDQGSHMIRDGVLDPVRIRGALVSFVHRLSGLRLGGDAFLISALLHRAGDSMASMQQAAQAGRGIHGPGAVDNLPVSAAELMLQVLREGGAGMQDMARAAALTA